MAGTIMQTFLEDASCGPSKLLPWQNLGNCLLEPADASYVLEGLDQSSY